jgi:hypothetical protein
VISGVTTLFNWTLKMDSKSIYPHIVRAAFAGAMLFAISMANVDVFGTGSMGLRFFELVCTLNVFIITISGITYFVTAVTEEKDAGTFALLRLAGMNSLSITLGKSTSRLVSSLMLLVIQIPFTFLSITLGGVLWNQIIAAYLALAAWMILVANLALFCSVRCATSGRAAGLAATTIGVFVFLPRISSAFLGAISPGVLSAGTIAFLEAIPAGCSKISVFDRLAEILGLTSGFTMLGIDFSTGLTTISTASIKGEVSIVAGQFWSSLLTAFVLFVVSTLTLDFWSAPADIAGPSENKSVRRWAVGRCWDLSVAWKEFLFFTGGRTFAIAKFLAGGLAFAGFRMFQEMDGYSNGLVLRGDYSWWAFLTFVFTLTAEVLLYSSGCLFYEVRQQTQSTLATVPISSVRILVEKFAGCAIALVPAIVWIFITLILSDGAIARNCSATMVSSYLIMLGFASHLAALLSLYTRWAALPLTILLAMPAFFCMAAPILGLTAVTSVFARSHNIEVTLLLSSIINLFWTWMFVLLPLQLWIRDRWIALSQQ